MLTIEASYTIILLQNSEQSDRVQGRTNFLRKDNVITHNTRLADLLTVAQVAEIRGVSTDAVYLWISKGQLPSVTVSRVHLIAARDLKKFEPPPRGNPNFGAKKKRTSAT